MTEVRETGCCLSNFSPAFPLNVCIRPSSNHERRLYQTNWATDLGYRYIEENRKASRLKDSHGLVQTLSWQSGSGLSAMIGLLLATPTSPALRRGISPL